jgi:hypothetical protein
MTAEDVILDMFGRDDHSQPLNPVQRAAEKELSYDVALCGRLRIPVNKSEHARLTTLGHAWVVW